MRALWAFFGSYLAVGFVPGTRGLLSANGFSPAHRPKALHHASSAKGCRWFLSRRCSGDDTIQADVMDAALSDEETFARRYFENVLRGAKVAPPSNIVYPELGPLILALACVTTYANSVSISVVLASLGGWAITLDPLLVGIVYGLLGGTVLRQVEIWRRQCMGEGCGQAGTINNDELLEKGILLGLVPMSIPAWGVLKDPTFGERSFSIVREKCTDLQKACLQVTGSLASCFLVHGVVQQALCAQFSSTAKWAAMSSIPEDPSATWWWPVVASGPALTPLIATFATAAFEFAVYLLVCEILFPVANNEMFASQEAISIERRRCARLFTLMGISSEVACLRAEAFNALAKQWEEQQKECKRRREITNAVRVLTASISYTMSGGSILAPLLTNIAVTDSVLGVIGGRSRPT